MGVDSSGPEWAGLTVARRRFLSVASSGVVAVGVGGLSPVTAAAAGEVRENPEPEQVERPVLVERWVGRSPQPGDRPDEQAVVPYELLGDVGTKGIDEGLRVSLWLTAATSGVWRFGVSSTNRAELLMGPAADGLSRVGFVQSGDEQWANYVPGAQWGDPQRVTEGERWFVEMRAGSLVEGDHVAIMAVDVERKQPRRAVLGAMEPAEPSSDIWVESSEVR